MIPGFGHDGFGHSNGDRSVTQLFHGAEILGGITGPIMGLHGF